MKSGSRKPRVVAFPQRSGHVRDALSNLGAKLGNSNAVGVLTVVYERDGGMTYHLHGSMRAQDLAFVGAVFQRWALESDE